jgi:histone H3/H4
MEHITKPSITRLARKAGVKSLSEDSYSAIYNIADKELEQILSTVLITNNQHNTVTIMPEDVYEAFKMNGLNIAKSTQLSSTTCNK